MSERTLYSMTPTTGYWVPGPVRRLRWAVE